MRDDPFHTFFQFMTGQIGDQQALGSGLRWFTVLLYWVILIASLSVAYVNFARDPEQRTGNHFVIFVMRIVSAGMWYLGTLWKLPLPTGGAFKSWMDQSVQFSSFQFHSDIMAAFTAHLAVVQPLVYLLEIFFTVTLMLGFMVRISGTIAALFILNLMFALYNDPTEWPWTYIGIACAHGMFAATQAGRSFGLDNLIAKRLVTVPAFFTGQGVLARGARWACSAA